MGIWTFTLIAVVCFTVYYYFKKQLRYFEELGIPYVPGWPLLGNMGRACFRIEHISETVKSIYNYNPEAKYVGAFNFVRPVIVLRDPELIKDVTIKNFDSFMDHQAFVDDTVDPLFGGALINIVGDRWKEARALLSPAFTSSKMKGMYELIVECANNFTDHLSKLPPDARKMQAMKELFTKFTNDAIATCAFGLSVDSLKDPKNDFYVQGRKATNIDGLMSIKFLIARSFPQIMRWFKIRIVPSRIAEFFKSVIKSTVDMRDQKGISRPDMLQLMMDARGENHSHIKVDITQMTAQAFAFFFGGFDTTSTQMCIIAHELAANPDIQKRLQAEIDKVMEKSNGKPSYEDINGILYLDAIFYESMRFHSPFGFLDRLCTKSHELPPALPGGKPSIVQPGMNIWIPVNGIHRDPKYYDNPDVFDPDRYYDKKVTINDVTNLGFGIGPRGCIGNRFALLETKVLMFFLLQKFNLKPNAKTCVPMKYNKSSFSITPEGGYWLDIEMRK